MAVPGRAHRESELDGSTEYLIWQTLFGTWDNGPIAEDRLQAYVLKAVREAKRHTSWTSADEEYEGHVSSFITGVLGDQAVLAAVGRFADGQREYIRAATLGQKLVQLTMPGVPDVYQGTEARGPVAGRSGQPSSGRLRAADRAVGQAGRWRPSARVGRGEATGDVPGAAAAAAEP